MQWALIDNTNTIQGILVYNGTDEFAPPEGLTLKQVPDNLWVGDKVDN